MPQALRIQTPNYAKIGLPPSYGDSGLGIGAVLIIAAEQIVTPLSAVLVLAWTKLSRPPWREIGYVRPKSWIAQRL